MENVLQGAAPFGLPFEAWSTCKLTGKFVKESRRDRDLTMLCCPVCFSCRKLLMTSLNPCLSWRSYKISNIKTPMGGTM